ncbi:MAG: 50S ribosomal protein L20 [Sedimentisphaerales bacterium]|nr:50S ribosomal protein L20 [Sedimentisphaerales bacterium]
MPRVVKGAARRQAKNRILKQAKGFRGSRGRTWRLAKEAVVRAQVYATRDRRQKKREFRGLWIIRLSAACAQRGIRYSQFVYGLKRAQIALNRKILSEMAIHDPEGFDAVVETVRKALPA